MSSGSNARLLMSGLASIDVEVRRPNGVKRTLVAFGYVSGAQGASGTAGV